MKKFLLTFVLLIGIVVGLFAQKLTYQAVIRDNNQQLVVNTAVKATVTITFSTGNPYSEEVNGSTNIHGLLSIEFGGDALNGRDWTNATIAVKVEKSDNSSIVYMDETHLVSAVPYALSVNGQSIQNYLTENHYVTETQVGQQIRDSIANIGVILIRDETLGTAISASTAEICELVMECVGDTLGKLNAKIEDLQNAVASRDSVINKLNYLLPFECGKSKVKGFDRDEYSTVKIGNQCWMAENLREWLIVSRGKAYENRGAVYYDWDAVMRGASSTNYPVSGNKVQGICPNGWHVPSKNEWDTLITYVSSIDAFNCDGGIANALAGGGLWDWDSTSTCAVGNSGSETYNRTGFSAGPTGWYFYNIPNLAAIRSFTFFWSATQDAADSSRACCVSLLANSSDVSYGYVPKEDYGCSVRCLRDEPVDDGGHADGSGEFR